MSASGQSRPWGDAGPMSGLPLESGRVAEHPWTSQKCHVWTAPSWQELSSRKQHWSVQPCVRPHMRALASSYFILTLLRFLRLNRSTKAELPSTQVFPANLTSGGTESSPRSRIRDGRAPGGRHHSLRRCEDIRPNNGDAPLDPCARAV